MTDQDSDLIIRPARAIELDLGMFRGLASTHDWLIKDGYDYDRIAYEFAISQRQAYRVLKCKSRPGVGFIGGLLTAADEAGFRRMFRIVNKTDPIGKE